jgi:hypothetical protein
MRFEDATQALGLDDDFNSSELARAFRRAALAHHPDRNRQDPSAVERFLAAQRAYALLIHHATDSRTPLEPITKPIRVRCVAMGKDIVGNPIVQSANASTGGIYGNSARWRTRKTAANTFVTYRIA